MLKSINKGKLFTGSGPGLEYNILRVVAGFPLAADLPSKSYHIQTAISEDSHPLATLKPNLILAAIATSEFPSNILSSLSTSLDNARPQSDDDDDLDRIKRRKMN